MHVPTRPCLLSFVPPRAPRHLPRLCDNSCISSLIVAPRHRTSHVIVVRSTHAIILPPHTSMSTSSSLSRLCHPNLTHHSCLLNLVNCRFPDLALVLITHTPLPDLIAIVRASTSLLPAPAMPSSPPPQPSLPSPSLARWLSHCLCVSPNINRPR
jgi:hypothetical protein